MPSICKCLCQQKTDIFVNKSKTDLLGIDVYYCRACNIYIRFKTILTNFINTIFHQSLKKLRCGCCSNKLRTKLSRKKSKDNREKSLKNKPILCACGCGEPIKMWKKCKYGKKERHGQFVKNHGHRKLEEIITRHCLFCNSMKTSINPNKNKTPIWYKYEKLGFLCNKCYAKHKYAKRKKIINNQNEIIIRQDDLLIR